MNRLASRAQKCLWKLVAGALLILPGAAQSQDPHEQLVIEQLFSSSMAFAYAGYTLTHEPVIARLPQNNEYWITIYLDAGFAYGLVAVCDSDCADIDLELYDSKGYLIDSDTLEDDQPILEVRPRWSDKYQLRVTIPSCRSWQCTFGVGIFGR